MSFSIGDVPQDFKTKAHFSTWGAKLGQKRTSSGPRELLWGLILQLFYNYYLTIILFINNGP